jgi:endo-1,4-beta-D-glucanase Y
MQYAVAADDRALFDGQLEFARHKLTGPYGLFYWKISHDAEMAASSSACIDDLRIIGAALAAADKWRQPTYAAFAVDIADNVRKYTVVDHVLRDFLNWRDYGEPVKADTLQLSYIETAVLRALAKRDADWQPILQRSGDVLLKGRRPSGLFFEQYDFAAGQYQGERQNMINQLYCALFAAEIEKDEHPFAGWLRRRFAADGVLYAQYDSQSGEPTGMFESTSVYALASRYAYRIGDATMGDALIKKLLEFQNLNPLSPMYGSFSDDEVYSFDNLEALIALRSYNERRR